MENKRVVAIVDDSATVRKFFQVTARKMGMLVFEFDRCKLFESFVTKEDRHAISLVVFDIELPDGNGLDLLESYRERLREEGAEIIVVTGKGFLAEQGRAQAEFQGVKFYTKPLSSEHMREMLQSHLQT